MSVYNGNLKSYLFFFPKHAHKYASAHTYTYTYHCDTEKRAPHFCIFYGPGKLEVYDFQSFALFTHAHTHTHTLY